MAWRRGWRLCGVLLLTAGCGNLSFEAPPPSAAAEAGAATPVEDHVSDETPVWLQQIEGQNGSSGAGDSVRQGLGRDPAAPGYSGETLTHQASGGSETGMPSRSQAILAQAQSRAATVGDIKGSGPGPETDPVSLQQAALPVVSGFRIQLATLPTPESAQQVWEGLQTAHPKILASKQMILIDLNLGYRGIFHRLEAGPFESLTAAWEACIALVRRKQGCVVSQP